MENYIIDNVKVGERIRRIREGLKMYRETFSEMINISDLFLGQIERGERSLSVKTLSRISITTGFSTDYILFGINENNSAINKINNILEKSSVSLQEYIYKILLTSFSFFKTNNNKE